MNNEIMTIAGQLAPIVVLGFVGALFFRQGFNAKWLFVALVLYLINDLFVTRALWTLPSLFPDARWNWEGKAYALIATLVVASLPQFGWKRIGLTWHQGKNPWLAYLLMAVLTLFFFALAALDGNGPSDWETIAFQWTMPGLEEEVFYRGTLLLAMNEAFPRKTNFLGAPIGYGGLLATLLFGFAHAISFGTQGFSFEIGIFLITGVPAFALLWLKERTGSLVLPIVGHNIANGASNII